VKSNDSRVVAEAREALVAQQMEAAMAPLAAVVAQNVHLPGQQFRRHGHVFNLAVQLSVLVPHIAEASLAQGALELVSGQLSEAVFVHRVPTVEIDRWMLGAEQVVIQADRAIRIQSIFNVLVSRVVGFEDAGIANCAVGVILAASLATEPALDTVVVLLGESVGVVQHTLLAKVSSKLYVAHLTLVAWLQV
jgi:hypothetical protein